MQFKHLFFALFITSGISAQGQKNATMDAYVTAEESVKQFSGTVLIIQKGKKVYQRSTLYANREWKIPNSQQTKYRIGSITKQFTAALILRLEEDGKLTVNDKLSKYYPGYPKGDSISIHMLLNHTSGIKNYTELPAFWSSMTYRFSVDSMIRVFKDQPNDFSPGKGWNYSNSGYYLLGMIIEKASGKKYGDYLKEQIINKLALRNTDLESHDSVYLNKANGYSLRGTHWSPAAFLSMEGPWAAGAIISTSDDLYTWIKALLSNKVLTPASTKKMITPEVGSQEHYAYGIISDSLGSHPRIWHNGGINGFSSYLAHFPEEDMTVVAFCNNEESADRVAVALSRIMFNEIVDLPYIPKEVKVDPAVYANYIGKYTSAAGAIELVTVSNRLYRRRSGSPDLELKPESATRFFYADMSDRFIEFRKQPDNSYKAFIISGADRIEMKKREGE